LPSQSIIQRFPSRIKAIFPRGTPTAPARAAGNLFAGLPCAISKKGMNKTAKNEKIAIFFNLDTSLF
jgi:hypothetical protein